MVETGGSRVFRFLVVLGALAVSLAALWVAGTTGARSAEAQEAGVPLILVPGVGGSHIVNGTEEKWPNADRMALSLSDEYFMDLALRPDGTEDPARDYAVGDIVRKAPVNLLPDPDVYQSTIDKLQAAGYREGVDLFVYPYDWRKDARGNNGRGNVGLISFVDKVRTRTGAPKVDIMAHSMGGMVTLAALEDTRSVGKVRKVLTMGTPVLGATQALGVLQYRMPCFLDPFGLCILNKETAQRLFNDFPGGYQLLPSRNFDRAVGAPLVIDWDKNGDGVKDGPQGYTKWSAIVRPAHNGSMLTAADGYHTGADTLTPADPAVQVTRMVADGSGTPGRIREYEDCFLSYFSCDIEREIVNTDGDATVPLHSADLYNPATGFDRRGPAKNVYFHGIGHGDLVKSDATMNYAVSFFRGSASGSATARAFSAQSVEGASKAPASGFGGVELETVGPVEGYVEDGAGNAAGRLDALPEDVAGQIPGGTYNEISGTKAFFLNEGGAYAGRFEVTGTGSLVRFRVRGYADGGIERQAVFYAEATEGATLSLSFGTGSDLEKLRLLVDEDGDGRTDRKVRPASVVAGEAASDRTAPETGAEVEDVVGGRKKITLSTGEKAAGSGVSSIRYAVGSDRGPRAKVRTYDGPFMVPAGETVRYLSIDRAGNTEPIESVVAGDDNSG